MKLEGLQHGYYLATVMISLLHLLCYTVCVLLSISGKLSSFFFFFCKSALQQYSVKFIAFALNLFSFLTGM